MKDKNAWRKCAYCGRYIKAKDFVEGRAGSATWYEWDYARDESSEAYEAWHVTCLDSAANTSKATHSTSESSGLQAEEPEGVER